MASEETGQLAKETRVT